MYNNDNQEYLNNKYVDITSVEYKLIETLPFIFFDLHLDVVHVPRKGSGGDGGKMNFRFISMWLFGSILSYPDNVATCKETSVRDIQTFTLSHQRKMDVVDH